MWIDRSLETRIRSLAGALPAILVTGARQVGKTSLLRHTLPDTPFVALDLPSAAQQAEMEPQTILSKHGEPIIFDEVQCAPGLLRYLKIAIDADRTRMGRFFMTGSQKFALMRHVSETLAGRIGILELDTLSSLELRQGGFTNQADILWRGGFPELYRNQALLPRDFYSSYIATYLDRDVRSAVRSGSLRDFERLLRACAIHSGQLLNHASLARDLGVAVTTVKDWIGILEASNQVAVIEPWFGNLQKRMVKTRKLYLRDTGLMAFLLGFDSPATMLNSASIGAVWETFVVGQVLRQLQSSGSAGKLFFFRDVHGNEVDLVLESGGKLQLIEVKWTEAFSPPPMGQIARVAGLLGAELLAPEHLLVARPQADYPVVGDLRIRVVNGFTHEFLAG